MVSRKTRKHKEIKSIRTFGQLILPLAVVMLFALFFISVKLFFMDPNDVYLSGKSTQNQIFEPIEQKNTDDPLISVDTGTENEYIEDKDSIREDVPLVPEQQVEIKKIEQPQKTPVKSKAKPQPKISPKQEIKAPVRTGQVTSQTKPRWDVQIGGFKVKASALALHNKAKTEGHTVYIVDSVKDGQPFYRVRVMGHETKENASKLAAKLQAVGYPTYLVSIK
ncbi:MAG: hypothetical protein GXZ13_04555 [Synergistaceae bacterium]|jgi:cell division protein FtsN|nr:hypothetical protein [Synergistaceae bacterium]